ncbi:UDP-N-acetylglucosamine--N-acetylmuramyl-(pentapeptide) pyrophosphoryl-undecaprenol N-acetylglucosamine transferase [Priestia filamentosa]|uniref:UDP-N-acetylglucosamine--N-acetylmuramyl- (pentapeptide) pyrophosphoryl-undecaprenol N-acetylglucosamine transferase n=1 Tax=Priestia filamentosa TaxID=1402861 RepID=UPI00397BC3F3
MKIVVTGGGTGGHLFPALLICEELIKEGHKVYYFGNAKCIEKEETTKRNIPFCAIPSKNTSKKDLKFVVENTRGILKAIRTMRKIKPDVVYSTGGFTTAPVLSAASFLKIPYVLHEQNTVVGLVNKIFRKNSSSFIHSFPFDVLSHEKVIGNLSRYEEEIKREESYVVFMGGSGGAKFINELAIQYAKDNPHKQVCLLSGRNFETSESLSNLTTFGFIEDMRDIYKKAEVVIARAGSTTLAELSFYGIPSVIIPMPNSADNHQEKNAEFYDWKNAIIKISQDEYAYYTLSNAINKLSDELKKSLSTSFKACYNIQGKKQIMAEILKVGKKK